MTANARSLAQISAYMADNRLKSVLEADSFQNMACEANVESSENNIGGPKGQTITSKSWRLDCIYNNKPLGFEKDL